MSHIDKIFYQYKFIFCTDKVILGHLFPIIISHLRIIDDAVYCVKLISLICLLNFYLKIFTDKKLPLENLLLTFFYNLLRTISMCFTYNISCFFQLFFFENALNASDIYLFINLCDHLFS